MSSREGYDAYCLYLAVNNHFHSDSYDFFKYNGKVSAKLESFMKRKDKYHFAKLSRLYNDELKDFLVANLSRQKYYVRNLLEQECMNNYKEFKKKKQKLTYVITEDLKYLYNSYKDIDVIFGIKNGQHSNILREYLGGKINAETFIAADKILNIFKDYDDMIQESFIWPKEKRRLERLAPFVDLEHKKLMSILRGIWHEHTS